MSMFQDLVGQAELSFLEYRRNWGDGVDPDVYGRYGRLTTWEEYRSAPELLDRLRPDRIVMLSIGSRNQLALRWEAARRGIEVVHVEHGYRLPATVRQDPAIGREPGDRAREALSGLTASSSTPRSMRVSPVRSDWPRWASGRRSMEGPSPILDWREHADLTGTCRFRKSALSITASRIGYPWNWPTARSSSECLSSTASPTRGLLRTRIASR